MYTQGCQSIRFIAGSNGCFQAGQTHRPASENSSFQPAHIHQPDSQHIFGLVSAETRDKRARNQVARQAVAVYCKQSYGVALSQCDANKSTECGQTALARFAVARN
jgi:hypothetical protein